VLAAPVEQAGDLSPADLRQGQLLWGSVDSPWVSKVRRPRFSQDLAALGQLEPKLILSRSRPYLCGRRERVDMIRASNVLGMSVGNTEVTGGARWLR
jgi:hypothetical protein